VPEEKYLGAGGRKDVAGDERKSRGIAIKRTLENQGASNGESDRMGREERMKGEA